MASDVKKMILKYGKCTAYAPNGRTTEAVTRCTGCGEKIKSTDDLTHVHFSLTKRKTCFFWHEGCTEKVWDRRIYVERK